MKRIIRHSKPNHIFPLQPIPSRSFYSKARKLSATGQADLLAAQAVQQGAGGVKMSPRVTAYLEGARQRERLQQEEEHIKTLQARVGRQQAAQSAEKEKEKAKKKKGGR